MRAAMDVDTPSGTNSGAGKECFEVRKRNAVASGPRIVWSILCHRRSHIMDLCIGRYF